MMPHRMSKNTSMHNQKMRTSRNSKRPCFTLKRPIVFQVRKSLVEYVDEELLGMETSVFYQRIFILAKNVEPKRESNLEEKRQSRDANQSIVDGETATLRTAENMLGDDEHFSLQSTPEGSQAKEPSVRLASSRMSVRIVEPFDPNVEIVTRTFRFYNLKDDVPEEAGEESAEILVAEEPVQPKDAFALFTEKLQELQKKCRNLSYTPDPICGLVVYMNEYTLCMLESGEDMMAIFCTELLDYVDEFWQSNRVFHIEDNIKETYTKELLFRRIPAVYLNEKFPPSTPTDEYLMGKQHLIIKEKLHNICNLVAESMEPRHLTETKNSSAIQSSTSGMSDPFDMDGNESEEDVSSRLSQIVSQAQRSSAAFSEALPTEVFRKLLPEIQRIELVLSSTRFYFTLQEFCGLYGNAPFERDDDSQFWPIQNKYTPPNIFRTTPFDINLTFADYAAEMNARLQEEQEKNKAEMEAAAAAEANAAAQAAEQSQPRSQQNAQASAKEEED